MAAPRAIRGFTLVEMLVSLTILSAVIGMATYSYSFFMRYWDGRLGRFAEAQAAYQRLDWLAAALQDTLPYVVRDEAGGIGFYFLGRDEGMTLVTMSPIFSVGRPALVRVFREPDGSGAWQLVYEEAPFGDRLLANADQRMDFRHRLIVKRGLPEPRFRYFGWRDLPSRAMAEDFAGTARNWYTEYDGLVRRQHPEKIELTLGGASTVFRIPSRSDYLLATYLESE
ncbi:MAG: prepilin-type N-terminal cleavage/methylation domain-containing protein [Gammaproteobacteria bacterium]|jgi:prepilin-type N-terminal cleavage/methylation domain-containing protein